MTRFLALVAVVAGGCFGDPPCDTPACNADVDTDAAPDSPCDEERDFFLPPDTFVEAQLEMTEGDQVSVEFDADGIAVGWNLHRHIGGDVVIHSVSPTSASDAADGPQRTTSPPKIRSHSDSLSAPRSD